MTFAKTTSVGTVDFLTYQFKGLHVDGYRQGGDDDASTDDVSFSWTSLDQQYKTVDAKGGTPQPQPPVSFTNTTPTPSTAPRCMDLTTKAAPATSSSDLHLRLNGIQGDSITKLHPNEIDATGFCFSGGGAGKFGSFTVQKLYDKSSGPLMKAMSDGTPISDGTVSFTSAGQIQQDYLKFAFKGLKVDGYRQGGHGSPLQEDVSLHWDTRDGELHATEPRRLARHGRDRHVPELLSTLYDDVPYEGRAFAQTHPDRLAVQATLFGLRPRRRPGAAGCSSSAAATART